MTEFSFLGEPFL